MLSQWRTNLDTEANQYFFVYFSFVVLLEKQKTEQKVIN
jgi:hypothetical protein